MQNVLRKKICFIGASAVGKTSLIANYASEPFSSKYHSTLGARITRATLVIKARLRELIIWDIKGETEFYHFPQAYLRGSDGFVFVADGTRPATCDQVLEQRERVFKSMGERPHVLLCNKVDLSQLWTLSETDIERMRANIPNIFTCSARDGNGIRLAMETLTLAMWSIK
jgi:small GTP-binding protein